MEPEFLHLFAEGLRMLADSLDHVGWMLGLIKALGGR